MESKTIRLNKYLSGLGFASRRKIIQFLQENNFTVNGKRIMEAGFRVNPAVDLMLLNQKEINSRKDFVYIILNKPKDVISTAEDEYGRKNVVDLVAQKERLFPVGRLDKNSKGLVLLTNDGDLALKLTHPRYHIPKTYVVLVKGKVEELKISKLEKGVDLKEGKTAPAKVKVIEEKNNRTLLEITLFEGKNHQIKKMLNALKIDLLELKRIAIGDLKLGELKTGEFRNLENFEVKMLKSE